MSFYDNLKNTPPAPARTPYVETEESQVLRLMKDKDIKGIATCAMDSIMSECSSNKDQGKHQVQGLLNCYAITSDNDGYSYSDWFRVEFIPWGVPLSRYGHNIPPLRRGETTFTTSDPENYTRTRQYISKVQCEAILRVLLPMMEEHGFPNGCLSVYARPMCYKKRTIVRKFFAGDVETFENHFYTAYQIEVDIHW